MTLTSDQYQNISRAISAYGQQEFNDSKQLVGTQIVGGSVTIGGTPIVSEREDFYGTIRFDKAQDDVSYLNSGTTISGKTRVNVATETSSEGELSEFDMDTAEYIKTYRTHGAEDYLVTPVLTRRAGAIGKIGEHYGRTRARDADAALVSVLKGVIGQELARANGVSIAGQAGSSAPTAIAARLAGSGSFGVDDANSLNQNGGFFYDVNSSPLDNDTAGTNTLIGAVGATKGKGAAVFENVLKAHAYGFSDVDVDFMYLVVDRKTYLDIQLANLLDDDHVVDGNVKFQTVLNGQYRILYTRTSLGSYNATYGTVAGTVTGDTQSVNAGSSRTSVLIRPGAVAFVPMGVNRPVAIDRDESVGKGAGRDELWLRWGFVMHPYGYSWAGSKKAFARNDDIDPTVATNATNAGLFGGPLAAAADRKRGFSGAANWRRAENVGNLRILPVFHS